MALRDNVKSGEESTLKIIDDSSLDEVQKTYYRNLIVKAAEGTNGLSKEEKLQSVSETCFSLVELNIKRDCKSHDEYSNLVKKIDDKFDDFGKKLDDISNRLDKNDKDTSKLKALVEDSNVARSTENEETDGKIDSLLLAISKLKWYWPAALVAIFGIIAYHPKMLDFIKSFF